MKTSEIYNLKEKLEKLETEYYHLHDWFGRSDRLIWTLRSLVFTIYTGVVVYAFDSSKNSFFELSFALLFVALFFCGMEICWLRYYWKSRTLRYKTIQQTFNDRLKDECLDIPFLNMDNNVFEKSKGEYTVRPVNIYRKMREPCGFYAGLIIVSTALYLLS